MHGFGTTGEIPLIDRKSISLSRVYINSKAFLLKKLSPPHASQEQVAHYNVSLASYSRLQGNGVLQLIKEYNESGTYFQLLEYFNGIHLLEYLNAHGLPSIPEFFKISTGIVRSLMFLHDSSLIQGDLQASSVLYDSESGNVKFCSYGFENQFVFISPVLGLPEERRLYYMAPEEAGSLTSEMDARSDLYSCGILLYELLTGAPPFIGNDSMEILYSHIARTPAAPHLKVDGIPPQLSSIVLKLLNKNQEDRYYSAAGLLHDLVKAEHDFNLHSTVSYFVLGEQDVPDKLILPDQLIGRENELRILYRTFDRVCQGGNEINIIVGEAGIGKSTLVNTLSKYTAGSHATFLSAKYDEFKKNNPYSAFIFVLKQYFNDLLYQGPDAYTETCLRIKRSFEEDNTALLTLFPEASCAFQSDDERADLSDALTVSVEETLVRLFSIFSTKEHPMVVFLDDVQWADNVSIELINRLTRDAKIKYFYCILSCRNEYSSLPSIVHRIVDHQKKKEIITLGPLNEEDTFGFISRILKKSDKETENLSRLLHHRSTGNPYFLRKILQDVSKLGLIFYDRESGWNWDRGRIREMDMPESLASAILEHFDTLDPNVQYLLQLASCMGNRFSMESLSDLSGQGMESIIFSLAEALEIGLIYFSRTYYFFGHDKIHETIYNSIDDKKRADLHYKIAQHELSVTQGDEVYKKIFYIVNQYNSGRPSIQEEDELITIINLNYLAGRKARNSRDYMSAIKYLQKALEFIKEVSGTNVEGSERLILFDLSVSLFYAGNLKEAEDLLTTIATDKFTPEQLLLNYYLSMQVFALTGQTVKALEYADKITNTMYRESPPYSVVKKWRDIIALKLRTILFSKSTEKLKNNLHSSEEKLLESGILLTTFVLMGSESRNNLVNEKLLILIANFCNRCASQHHSRDFLIFILETGIPGTKNRAFARRQVDQYTKALSSHQCERDIRISFLRDYFLNILSDDTKTLAEIRRILLEAHRQGDYLYSVRIAIYYLLQSFRSGINIDFLIEDLKGIQQIFTFLDTPHIQNQLSLLMHLFLSIKSSGETLPTGEQRYIVENDNWLNYLYAFSSFYYYWYRGNEEGAIARMDLLNECLTKTLDNSSAWADILIHKMLALFNIKALYREEASESDFQELRETFNQYVEIVAIIKTKSRIYKQITDVFQSVLFSEELINPLRFELLMKELAEAGNIRYLAIACEFAGRYYANRKAMRLAKVFLSDSLTHYETWGAKARNLDIIQRFPALAQSDSFITPGDGTASLDLNTLINFESVLRASRVIAGEIVLPKLSEKVLKILIEYAGATRAVLLLYNEGKLSIIAHQEGERKQIETGLSIPMEEYEQLPLSIIHYVLRSEKPVVITESEGNNMFAGDSYFAANKPKAILSVPMYSQGNLRAVFYAENNYLGYVFSQEKMGVLQLILSYAATSIDNAFMYSNLEEKVEERTQELQALHYSIDEAYRQIKFDLTTAENIQRQMLPRGVEDIKGHYFDIFFQPMTHVGGDFYDIIELENGIVRLFLADATGHGVQAALVTMIIQQCFERFKHNDEGPHKVLEKLNDFYMKHYEFLNAYFSCVIVDIDRKNKKIRFSMAGHPSQALLRTDDVVFIKSKGTVIGYLEDLTFEVVEKDFSEMDRLLLFSDGVYEVFNTERKIYGERRFHSFLTTHRHLRTDDLIRAITDDVKNFIGANSISIFDDVTMVAAGIIPD